VCVLLREKGRETAYAVGVGWRGVCMCVYDVQGRGRFYYMGMYVYVRRTCRHHESHHKAAKPPQKFEK
jgi:hypothetical protein